MSVRKERLNFFFILFALGFIFFEPSLRAEMQKKPFGDLTNAQELSTEVVSENKQITAGDLIVLSVRLPEGTSSEITPAMSESLKEGPVEWGNGRILRWSHPKEKLNEILIFLTTYQPGLYVIDPIPLADRGKLLYKTQAKSIQCQSVGGDKSKDDIYPPFSTDLPRWVWIVLSLLALFLVLSALWWVSKWQKRKKEMIEKIMSAPRVLSPLEEFEEKSKEILSRNYLATGKFKPFYFSFSDLAKRFLGKNFRFDAEERTTRELVYELKNLQLSESLITRWKEIFDEMDIIKFTDQRPGVEPSKSLADRLLVLARESAKTKDTPHAI